MDTATRMIVAKATKTATAKAAAKFFKENVIHAHGAPNEVLTDRGSEYEAQFEKLMTEYKITNRKCTPRHLKTNGMVERANKTLTQILRTLMKGKKTEDWDQHVSAACQAYNTSIHEVTGYTPYYLLRGTHPPPGNLLGEPHYLHQKAEDPIESLAESRRIAAERTR